MKENSVAVLMVGTAMACGMLVHVQPGNAQDRFHWGTRWAYEMNEDIHCVAVASDGAFVAVGSETKVSLFDRDGNEAHGAWPYESEMPIIDIAMETSAGDIIAAGSTGNFLFGGGIVVILDKQGMPKRSPLELKTQISSVAISPDGSHWALTYTHGLGWWDTVILYGPDGNWLWHKTFGESGTGSVSISSGGQFVAFGAAPMDIDPGELHLYSYDGNLLWSKKIPPASWPGGDFSVAISADATSIIAGNQDHEEVYYFDQSGNVVWTYPTGRVYSVSVSADGSFFAVGTQEKVLILDRDRNIVGDIPIQKVNDVALSSDGSVIAVSTDEKKVYLFERNVVEGAFPVVSKPLVIAVAGTTPEEYHTGDTLVATFGIRNAGTASITLDVVTVGGRYTPSPDWLQDVCNVFLGDLFPSLCNEELEEGTIPGGTFPDFTFQPQEGKLMLDPGETYDYEGELLLEYPGAYHFFCAYQDQDGQWNPAIELGAGLTDEDRIEDIEVLSRPYIASIDPQEGAPGIEVTIEGLNLTTRDGFEVLTFGVVNFGDETVIGRPNEDSDIIVKVPSPREVGESPVDVVVKNDFGESNRVQFTYKEPVIEEISPPVRELGEPVTIRGKHFGNHDPHLLSCLIENFCIRFGSSEVDIIRSWADEEIVVWAPSDYGTGNNREYFKEKLCEFGICGITTLLPIEIPGWITAAFGVCESDAPAEDTEYDLLIAANDLLIQTTSQIITAGTPCLDILAAAGIENVQFLAVELITDQRSLQIEVGVTVETPVGTSNVEPFIYRASPLIWAMVQSPVELRMYDSEGRVAGMVNGVQTTEIPGSFYDQEQNMVVISSATDTYSYEVVGQEQGSYGFIAGMVKDGNETVFTASDIPTRRDTRHSYDIDWEVLLQGGNGVVLQADEDGDGTPEATITADRDVTKEEFEQVVYAPLSAAPLGCGAGICGAGVVGTIPMMFFMLFGAKRRTHGL